MSTPMLTGEERRPGGDRPPAKDSGDAYMTIARGNVVTSVAGGVLFGLGATLLLISHAALPFGDGTPLVVTVTAIALGLLIGFLGRRARRRREQAAIASAPVAGG